MGSREIKIKKMSADSIFEFAQDFEEKSVKITTKLDSRSSKTQPPS